MRISLVSSLLTAGMLVLGLSGCAAGPGPVVDTRTDGGPFPSVNGGRVGSGSGGTVGTDAPSGAPDLGTVGAGGELPWWADDTQLPECEDFADFWGSPGTCQLSGGTVDAEDAVPPSDPRLIGHGGAGGTFPGPYPVRDQVDAARE